MRLAALHQDSHTGVGKSNSFKVARRGRESLTSYKVNLLLSHGLSCLPYGKMNTRTTFYNMNLRNLSRTLMRVLQCLQHEVDPWFNPTLLTLSLFKNVVIYVLSVSSKKYNIGSSGDLTMLILFSGYLQDNGRGVQRMGADYWYTQGILWNQSLHLALSGFWCNHRAKGRKKYMWTLMHVSNLAVDRNWMAVWFVSLLISQASTNDVMVSCMCTNMHKLVGWTAWFRLGAGGVGCI